MSTGNQMTIDSNAVVWSEPLTDLGTRPLLLLLHGYGSNEQDPAQLTPHLPDGVVTVAIRAPLSAGEGFAWVPIAVPGRPDPAILDASTQAVLHWIDEAIPADTKIGLLGFSQGGLMVSQLLRHQPARFLCGVMLSGFVLDQDLPADTELGRRRTPVFYGRGNSDEIIAPDAFDRAELWLPKYVDLTERIYPGLAHSINAQELRDVSEFLQETMVRGSRHARSLPQTPTMGGR